MSEKADAALKEIARRRATVIGEFRNCYGERFVVFTKCTGNYFLTGDECGWRLDLRIERLALYNGSAWPVVIDGKDKFKLTTEEAVQLALMVMKHVSEKESNEQRTRRTEESYIYGSTSSGRYSSCG